MGGVEFDNALEEGSGGSVTYGNKDSFDIHFEFFSGVHVFEDGAGDYLLDGGVEIYFCVASFSRCSLLGIQGFANNFGEDSVPSYGDGGVFNDALG